MRAFKARTPEGYTLDQALAIKPEDPAASPAFIRELADLDRYGADWDRLADHAGVYFPRYEDARSDLVKVPFLAVLNRDDAGIRGIGCFVNARSREQFSIGERRLGSLPIRETRLLCGNVLGVFEGDQLRDGLRQALAEWPFDLFTLGEIERGSALHQASRHLGATVFRTRRDRKDPIRWLIPLPASFDEYLASLRPSTRKSISYAIRRFERECAPSHQIVTRPDQVADFLRAGETISRKTYQWDVGERLVNDAATQDRYRRLADNGRLLCHLLRVDGKPCAFSRGEICGNVYHYETPGFDPRWERYSPGLVLLAWTIRELIERQPCQFFDFGLGGDDHGYKARFGTTAIPCISLQFANVARAYSLLLFAAHGGLSLAKDIASRLLGQGAFRQKLKKAFRRTRT